MSKNEPPIGGRRYVKGSLRSRIMDMSERNPSFSAEMIAEFCDCCLDRVHEACLGKWSYKTGKYETMPAHRSSLDNAIKQAFRKVIGYDPIHDGLEQ